METARAASPGHVVRLHGAPRIRSMFLQVVRDRGNSLGFQRPTLISGEERSRRPGDRTWSSRSGKKNEQLVGVCASFEQELVSKAGTGQGVLIASTSTAISPSTSSISPSEQHFALVGFIACVAVGTLSCFFLAAIPTLLAFKKAAESLEKLADAAREELPGTMAAVRLSGLEISDLTMELSDLGQEISEGVRSSARAVRAAEDGLRRIGSAASKAPKIQTKGGGGSSSTGIRG